MNIVHSAALSWSNPSAKSAIESPVTGALDYHNASARSYGATKASLSRSASLIAHRLSGQVLRPYLI